MTSLPADVQMLGYRLMWALAGLIALRKEKLNVSGWDFFKAGALAMPVALAAAMGGVILMQTL